MTLLPVAQRELRVAARQPRTYYVRMLAALAALAVLWYVGRWSVFGAGGGGRTLFFGLTQLAAWVCIFGGSRLTADAISREKREGTLGFLFLSHLSGFDVVLGKLLAHATYAFYALLAIIPIAAIPLLDGGVQAGEFWFTMLALANTLFFAVSLGLLVSALSRDLRRAVGLSTGAALFFWLGLPILAELPGLSTSGGPRSFLSSLLLCLSPASTHGPVLLMGGAGMTPWLPLACTHALAWAFLVLAAIITRGAWRERPGSRASDRTGSWWRNVSLGSPARRAVRRTATLDRNAFLWLRIRRRWKPLMPGLFVSGWVGLLIVVWGLGERLNFMGDLFGSVFVPSCAIVHLILKFWIAGEAASGITSQREGGTLELLLTTPLTARDVVRGQFLALRHQFGWALLAVGVLTLGGTLLFAVNAGGEAGAMGMLIALAATVALATDAATLMWLSTWRGIVSRKPHHAAGSAAFRVLVLPWLLLLFLGPAAARVAQSAMAGLGDALLLWGVVGFGGNLLWWQWSRQQLRERFRAEAARACDGSKPEWLERLTSVVSHR